MSFIIEQSERHGREVARLRETISDLNEQIGGLKWVVARALEEVRRSHDRCSVLIEMLERAYTEVGE